MGKLEEYQKRNEVLEKENSNIMASLTDVERERKEYDKIIKDFGKGVNKEKAEFEKLVN